MARVLSQHHRDRYEGYFDRQGNLVNSELQPKELVPAFPNLRRSRISEKGNTIIENIEVCSSDINLSKVMIAVPGKRTKAIYFYEIIQADKIIRFHLKNGEYPISNTSDNSKCDFRNPHMDIGGQPVLNNSYAPRLAELIRKSIRTKQSKSMQVTLEPDVAECFPDTDSVNQALRDLIKIARRITT